MVHLFTQKLNNKYSAFTVICTSIELKFSFFFFKTNQKLKFKVALIKDKHVKSLKYHSMQNNSMTTTKFKVTYFSVNETVTLDTWGNGTSMDMWHISCRFPVTDKPSTATSKFNPALYKYARYHEQHLQYSRSKHNMLAAFFVLKHV